MIWVLSWNWRLLPLRPAWHNLSRGRGIEANIRQDIYLGTNVRGEPANFGAFAKPPKWVNEPITHWPLITTTQSVLRQPDTLWELLTTTQSVSGSRSTLWVLSTELPKVSWLKGLSWTSSLWVVPWKYPKCGDKYLKCVGVPTTLWVVPRNTPKCGDKYLKCDRCSTTLWALRKPPKVSQRT